MKILVLGSSGFLGKNLLNVLKTNEDNYYLFSKEQKSYNEFDFIKCDLQDHSKFKKYVKNINPDICIDLSWLGIPDYSVRNNSLNLNIKKRIYTTLSHYNCKKIISIGSCWEYGELNGRVSEQMQPYKSPNIFAQTKLQVLDHLKSLSYKSNLNYIWLRIFFVYGPYGKKTSLLSSIISQYKKNNEIKLNNYTSSHDYIYVYDVVRAINLCILNNIDSGIYNVGSGKSTSNIEFLKSFHKVTGKKNDFSSTYTEKKTDEALIANYQKIHKLIGWKPLFTIHKGLNETLKILELNA